MGYDIIAGLQNGNKLAYLNQSLGGYISNGTASIAGAPVTLALGANVITVVGTGTVYVTMPSGSSASAASTGGTIAPSPTLCPAGLTTPIVVTVAGTITITVTCNATAITVEVPGLRTITDVVSVSISGGYKADPAAVTVAGNKVTIQPQYYRYTAGADGVAINVPVSVDLSGQTFALTVIGY